MLLSAEHLSINFGSRQLLDDVKRAVCGRFPVELIYRTGGIIPTPKEVLGEIKKLLK